MNSPGQEMMPKTHWSVCVPPRDPLLDVLQDAVQFIQAVVVDNKLA